MPLIDIEALENLPKYRDLHIWADYTELLCFFHPDGLMSKGELADRVSEGRIVGETSPADEDAIDSEKEAYDPESADETKSMPSKVTARDEQLIEDIFEHLKYRYTSFGQAYPFTFSPEKNCIEVHASQSAIQSLYLLTLLGANLRLVPKAADRNTIADIFEVISAEAIRKYLPIHAEIDVFGANSYATKQPYTGHIFTKIEALAKYTRNSLHPNCKKSTFKPNDTGDGGLDVIAKIPILDRAGSELLLFGQCACTEAWVIKQFSSMAITWRNKITFDLDPINCVFVPFCYRAPTGEWFNRDKIVNSMMWDRLRIVMSEPNLPYPVGDTIGDLIKQESQQKMDVV